MHSTRCTFFPLCNSAKKQGNDGSFFNTLEPTKTGKEKEVIALRKDQFRGDFEIIDEQKKCRGFIWKYGNNWCIRIDDQPTQYRDTYDEAASLALQIVEI